MAKTRHTKGTWKFDCNCVVTSDGTKGIAIVEPIGSFWEGEAQAVTDDDEMRANGELLAAAPYLLTACRLALGSLKAAGFENATIRVCENAVAKAEGGAA